MQFNLSVRNQFIYRNWKYQRWQSQKLKYRLNGLEERRRLKDKENEERREESSASKEEERDTFKGESEPSKGKRFLKKKEKRICKKKVK